MPKGYEALVPHLRADAELRRAGVDPDAYGFLSFVGTLQPVTRTRLGRASGLRRTTLRDAIVGVLEESIALRGTSFRDYVDASGGRGGFAAHLAAYGRAGLPCPRCGNELQATHEIDGRSTVDESMVTCESIPV